MSVTALTLFVVLICHSRCASRSFIGNLIVDRIHAILEERGLKQKDLANMLGKKESEISKWMRGTHNFTIDTISSIENVLGSPILQVAKAHS